MWKKGIENKHINKGVVKMSYICDGCGKTAKLTATDGKYLCKKCEEKRRNKKL